MDPLELKPDARMRNASLSPGQSREVKTDIEGCAISLVLDKLAEPPN